MSSLALSGNQDHNQSKSPFDSIKRVDREGCEYWMARELMKLLGYVKWQRFEDASIASSRAIIVGSIAVGCCASSLAILSNRSA